LSALEVVVAAVTEDGVKAGASAEVEAHNRQEGAAVLERGMKYSVFEGAVPEGEQPRETDDGRQGEDLGVTGVAEEFEDVAEQDAAEARAAGAVVLGGGDGDEVPGAMGRTCGFWHIRVGFEQRIEAVARGRVPDADDGADELAVEEGSKDEDGAVVVGLEEVEPAG
jgi:hypothetical protein